MNTAIGAEIEDLTREGRKLLTSGNSGALYSFQCFNHWVERVAGWLARAAPGTGLSATWSGLSASPLVLGKTRNEGTVVWAAHSHAIQTRLQWLGAVPARLAEIGAPASPATPAPRDLASQGGNASEQSVFLVHGQAETKDVVARLIESMGVRCVILNEQANEGLTLIEKFEHHSKVRFAVVLLTGDDVGGLVTQVEQKPRARQNVILELGFFLGALGRPKVCALYADGVELPSDFDGVAYVPLDRAGAWKVILLREMKAAGLEVDANRII